MGGHESKEKEAQILDIFSQEERVHVHALFLKIVGNQHALTEPFLKKYVTSWLPQIDQLWRTIYECQVNKGHVKDNKVSELRFGAFLGQVFKGNYGEKANILSLLSGQVGSQVHLYQLYKTVCSFVQCYLDITAKDHATWKCSCNADDVGRMSQNILALDSIPRADDTSQYRDCYEVENWIAREPMFLRMFDRVFHKIFPVLAKHNQDTMLESFLPVVTNVDWSKTSTILDTLSISFINRNIPREQQKTWRLLYSNRIHGDSFSQLTRFIMGKGPSVMVVQDSNGHLFGCYVSTSWEIKPTFYGGENCFLFTLKPRYGAYNTTGYNNNFMYLNQGQETLPNGLGLGGQLEYFGLWIDSSFNSGHSKAKPKCTTYGSPQLSCHPEFTVECLEVWAVGPEKKKNDSDDEEEAKTSILDKDLAAKAILELAGKTQHSEGIRDLIEDEPEMSAEMKRKMNTIPKLL
ncbi:MTOR-associated protein MEAK7-like [Dreissena polymorpha]|uniref:MTOR-associated protein MEAK7 n=1 Tax=Dreissena polymorpha TaxID=45954 RepID=A0A9D4IFZ0_DREPO|nr:MTOR-associated protein MEAK7-like [Dreissena polymorpha]KAH3772580.1 hypothetical protein DPMN_173921 [Dreissena polymorpha]